MGCSGECLDLGPPPNSILFLPPPPLPAFLKASGINPGGVQDNGSASPCAAHLCDWDGTAVPPSYVEMPRQVDIDTSWSNVNLNTNSAPGSSTTGYSASMEHPWLLLIAIASVFIVVLGALLALLVLRLRDRRRSKESTEQREITACKSALPADAALYSGGVGCGVPPHDRTLWAQLTPRGTRHFLTEPHHYPNGLYREPHHNLAHEPEENHYEVVDNLIGPSNGNGYGHQPYHHHDRGNYVEYSEPASLLELGGWALQANNPDMRCASSLRRAVRPRVSPPQRIEHPNLPPLNLQPTRTLRRPQLSCTLPRYMYS